MTLASLSLALGKLVGFVGVDHGFYVLELGVVRHLAT